MERLTSHTYNNQTRIVEKFIKDSIGIEGHPLKNTCAENVMVVVKALMEHYGREYEAHTEYVEWCNATMIFVTMKLDSLDDWDGEKMSHSTKRWLHIQIRGVADVLGLPTAIIYDNGHYYALWERNFVTSF